MIVGRSDCSIFRGEQPSRSILPNLECLPRRPSISRSKPGFGIFDARDRRRIGNLPHAGGQAIAKGWAGPNPVSGHGLFHALAYYGYTKL
jgi:hypothetical protein